jgi:hypothetical protein
MFLASAYGFETGPYSEGNIVLQPIIGCGPCNPNKSCAKTDCHDHIEPELIAKLAAMRLKEDFKSLPEGLIDPSRLIIYRSHFDEQGFCDLQPLTSPRYDQWCKVRNAYRRMWLEELGGYKAEAASAKTPGGLALVDGSMEGSEELLKLSSEGGRLIAELIRNIKDITAPAQNLGNINAQLGELDRRIEQTGFHHAPFGPMTRMFIFAKENLSGSEALDLASQMGRNYEDLARRCKKLGLLYQALS